MFLAGGRPGACEFTAVQPDSFLESLHVFDGELTCCRFEHKGMEACDRQSLVVPILGLYGELIRAAHDGIKDGSADMSTVGAFLKEIEKHQETVFPRTFKRVMWRKNRRLVEEVPLFADLIDRMKARIKQGTMFVSQERGGTESTKSTEFVRHGASEFVRHGASADSAAPAKIEGQSNFLRHGGVSTSVAVASGAAPDKSYDEFVDVLNSKGPSEEQATITSA
jgi:hypothetical protein